jgi:hypothetical protein
MTVEQLRTYINETYGMGDKTPYPKIFNVDADTYGNVCHAIFQNKMKSSQCNSHFCGCTIIEIHLGINGGVMFKNIELIVGI